MIQIPEHESFYVHEASSTYFGFMREENIEDIETFYDEIAKALCFPEKKKKNLDALEDMLNDLEWIPYQYIFLIVRSTNSLSISLDENFDGLMDVLSDVSNEKFEMIMIE